MKTFNKCCTFNAVFNDNDAINCVTAQKKKVSFTSSLANASCTNITPFSSTQVKKLKELSQNKLRAYQFRATSGFPSVIIHKGVKLTSVWCEWVVRMLFMTTALQLPDLLASCAKGCV
jgi:hypothetical protein